ncbi:hypothetical protein GQR58_001680 [Nymphon striatum]|nr:hypothetical protein GQR58_001680 [Nymphon striatum]
MDDIDEDEWNRKLKAGKEKLAKFKRKNNLKSKPEKNAGANNNHELNINENLMQQNDSCGTFQPHDESIVNCSLNDGILGSKPSTELSSGALGETSLRLSADSYVACHQENMNDKQAFPNESVEISSGEQSCAGIEFKESSNSNSNVSNEPNLQLHPSSINYPEEEIECDSDGVMRKNAFIDISSGNLSSFDSRISMDLSSGDLSCLEKTSSNNLFSQIESLLEDAEKLNSEPMILPESQNNKSEASMLSTVSAYNKKLIEYKEAMKHRDDIIKQLTERLKVTIDSRNEIQKDSDMQSEKFAFKLQSLQLQLEQAGNILKRQKDKTGGISAEDFLKEKTKNIQLEQDTAALEKELSDVTNKVTKLEQELELEVQNVNKVQLNCQELVQEKQKSANEIRNLMKEIEMLQREVFNVKEARNNEKIQHAKELTSLQDELDERYGNQINIIKNDIRNTYEKQLDAAKLETNKLLQIVKEKDDQLACQSNIDHLNLEHENDIKCLKKQFDLSKSDLELQIHSLQKSVDDQNNNLLSCETSFKLVDSKLKEINEKYMNKCKKTDELLHEVEPLHAEIQSLNNYITKLSTELAEKDSMNLGLKNDLECACANELTFKNKIEQLEFEMKSLTSENNDMNIFLKSIEGNAFGGALPSPAVDGLQGLNLIKLELTTELDGSSCDTLPATAKIVNEQQERNILSESICDQPVLYEHCVSTSESKKDSETNQYSTENECDTSIPSNFNVFNFDKYNIDIVSSDIFESSIPGDSLCELEEKSDCVKNTNYYHPQHEYSFISRALEVESEKQKSLKEQLSQLANTCNKYKEELKLIKSNFKELINNPSSLPSYTIESFSNDVHSNELSGKVSPCLEIISECNCCIELRKRLEAKTLLKNLICKNYDISCKEFEIEKKYIILTSKFEEQNSVSLLKAELNKNYMQELEVVKRKILQDHSLELNQYKAELDKRFKESLQFEIEKAKNYQNLQVENI